MNKTQLAAEFSDSRLTLNFDHRDILEQMAVADHADWVLLRLVLCAAGATLLLALASSLGA
jgi:hypothetical protein